MGRGRGGIGVDAVMGSGGGGLRGVRLWPSDIRAYGGGGVCGRLGRERSRPDKCQGRKDRDSRQGRKAFAGLGGAGGNRRCGRAWHGTAAGQPSAVRPAGLGAAFFGRLAAADFAEGSSLGGGGTKCMILAQLGQSMILVWPWSSL